MNNFDFFLSTTSFYIEIKRFDFLKREKNYFNVVHRISLHCTWLRVEIAKKCSTFSDPYRVAYRLLGFEGREIRIHGYFCGLKFIFRDFQIFLNDFRDFGVFLLVKLSNFFWKFSKLRTRYEKRRQEMVRKMKQNMLIAISMRIQMEVKYEDWKFVEIDHFSNEKGWKFTFMRFSLINKYLKSKNQFLRFIKWFQKRFKTSSFGLFFLLSLPFQNTIWLKYSSIHTSIKSMIAKASISILLLFFK